MKGLYLLSFFLFALSVTYSQDITATLSDNTAAQNFLILNAQGDTLFRARGDGATGIGTNTPLGLLEVRKTSIVGRPVYIYGEQADIGVGGGSIEIVGGSNANSLPAGQIMIEGSGSGGEFGANVSINGGEGYEGGDINITSGSGEGWSGSINLTTPFSYQGNDRINLITGDGVNGSGWINIETGSTSGGANNVGEIKIKTGNGDNGGLIRLEAGNICDGGDIILTPSSCGGLVVVNGSGTYTGTWTQSSDQRYKKNIKPLKNVLSKLKQIDGVSYEFKRNKFPEKNFADGKQIGLIAQNIEKVYPELVKTDNEGYKSVAYQNLVAVLIQAVKEQQRSIDELKQEVEQLKSIKTAENVEVSSLGN